MNHKFESRWLGRFFELVDFKVKYGTSDVPNDRSGKYNGLGYWVQRQRMLYNKKTIERRNETPRDRKIYRKH